MWLAVALLTDVSASARDLGTVGPVYDGVQHRIDPVSGELQILSANLMMGYFKAIPKELEECARIDGASRWKAMVYIILPVAVPGILSAGIFAFTLSWNEFIYALVFLSSPDQKTVPVGVTSELIRGDVFFWGPLMAGALLGSIPVAIVYSFFVEHYVSGLTGSVKG